MIYIYCSKYFNNIDILRLYILRTLLDEVGVQYKCFCDYPNDNIKCEQMKNIKFKDDDVIMFTKTDMWFVQQHFSHQKKLLFTKIPYYDSIVLFDFEDDAAYAHQVKTLDLLFFCTDELLQQICGKNKQLNDKASFCICDDVNKMLVDEDINKNGRFQINIWNSFNEFAEQLLNCNFIYTDNIDGIALSVALNKKMKFYFARSKKQTVKVNTVFEYFGIQIQGNAAIDNAHIQQQLQNGRELLSSCISNVFAELKPLSKDNMHVKTSNMTIADYSTFMMMSGSCPLLFYNKKECYKKKTYDFTAIQVFFGNQKSSLHVEAAKNAIAFNLDYSNDRPKQWIFIEYNTHEFEYLKQFGIEYYHISRNPKSDGLFMKECLWNIAWRKYAKSENLCFIDSDIVYLDCDWVKKTYDGFKKYDAFQNFSYSVRSEISSGISNIDESICYRYKLNKIAEYNNQPQKSCKGYTGFNVCIKKTIMQKIDGFLNCPSVSGDFIFMYLLLSYVDKNFPLYLDHHTKKGFQFNRVFGKELKIGCNNSIILHYAHGNSMKNYDLLNLVQRRCGNYYQLIIKENNNGLIEWTDTHCANICKKSISQINAQTMTYKNIEDILQRNIIEEYGQIDNEYPLLFVTCFNPGVNISTKQVLQTKTLLDKYCLDKHDFVCITNESIPGIKCIPISRLDITSADFQMEMWHCNYFDNLNTSVMYIDLDIVPLDYFRLPRCPKDTIWMIDENQLTESYGTKFNFGCVYFNGDFSFIYKEIVENFDKMYKYYNDLQPFVTHLLLSHNIKIQNLLNFMNLQFIDFKWHMHNLPDLSKCRFIHFIGPTKPWNFIDRRYKDIIDANIALSNIRNFYNKFKYIGA